MSCLIRCPRRRCGAWPAAGSPAALATSSQHGQYARNQRGGVLVPCQ